MLNIETTSVSLAKLPLLHIISILMADRITIAYIGPVRRAIKMKIAIAGAGEDALNLSVMRLFDENPKASQRHIVCKLSVS